MECKYPKCQKAQRAQLILLKQDDYNQLWQCLRCDRLSWYTRQFMSYQDYTNWVFKEYVFDETGYKPVHRG